MKGDPPWVGRRPNLVCRSPSGSLLSVATDGHIPRIRKILGRGLLVAASAVVGIVGCGRTIRATEADPPDGGAGSAPAVLDGDDRFAREGFAARGQVVFTPRGRPAVLWLFGGGVPAVACPLFPGPGACETAPPAVQPVAVRDPLAPADGRLHVLFVDPATPDSFALWRSRPP